MSITTFDEKLKALSSAILSKAPYTAGTCPLSQNESTLFYRKGAEASWIDFSQPSEDKLKDLMQACDPATFGANNKDVLDESYRKAYKMDATNFASQFTIGQELLNQISAQLAGSAETDNSITAELYKLNVYGPGSFFKAHKDTPRAQNMFGSLVVVLPTPHDGGNLVLRHQGKEWTFDSAAMISQAGASFAYIAFFSDVEHEVTVVKTGYRVTLTYNLYTDIPCAVPTTIYDNKESIKATFLSLLSDKLFLPEGGLIGFGLQYKYPLKSDDEEGSIIKATLKGNDAVISLICSELKLKASQHLIYHDDRHDCALILDDVPSMDDMEVEDLSEELIGQGGQYIQWTGSGVPRRHEAKTIHWITPITNLTRHASPYVAYGNEATLGYAYGDVCLVVKVGEPMNRFSPHA